MDDRRELRIAPVMTGGTSLAVWMGGATYELYRMARSWVPEPPDPAAGVPGATGRSIYADLLDLTDTVPVIDVLTGTSAGGLNGTLLATACHLGLPTGSFRTLRDTWLDVADIQQLLRRPSDADPPSLLRGDDYFAVKVEQQLLDWHDETPTASPQDWNRDVDLVATVTTINAEPRSRSDHFGEQLNEVSHAQQLRFRSSAGDFDRANVAMLATAARTSASIPGVFEPSYLAVGTYDARASSRPDFEGRASFRTSRWAVDGGVVVNLPLTEAIARVFDRTSSGEVRRVVLYVSPTPSAAHTSTADHHGREPTIRAALQTAVLAPRAEGIAEDVDEIERHNRIVEHQIEARRASRTMLNVLDLGDTVGPNSPTDRVLEAYRRQRAVSSVTKMLGRAQEVTTDLPIDRVAEIRARLLPARRELFPPREHPWALSRGGVAWSWGIEPVEQAVGLVLSILNRALALLPADAPATICEALGAAKQAVHGQRAAVASVRTADTDFWLRYLPTVPGALPSGDLTPLVDWSRRSYEIWPVHGDEQVPVAGLTRQQAFTTLADAHRAVAGALVAAHEAVRTAASLAKANVHRELAEEGAALEAEVDSMLGADALAPDDDPATVDEHVQRAQRILLALHVLQAVFVGEVVRNEQRVELMQLSWNSWNGLDERRKPEEKLAGPELGRLGAFVKRSWRANDWLWGRMDASYRLVLLLLDPARIRRLGKVDALRSLVERTLSCAQLPSDVAVELDRLADPTVVAPSSLPATARALARVLQSTIAQEELEKVADDVRRSERQGGNEASSRPFLRAIDRIGRSQDGITDADTAELLGLMRIGQDTVRDELGFGLMNRVSTGLVSVLINSVTGTRSGLSFLSRVLRPMRAPAQGVASVVRTTSSDSKLGQAVTAAVLAIAGAIVALGIVGEPLPAGTFVVAAGLLTLVFVGAMLRSGLLWLGLVFTAAAAIITLAVVGGDIDEVIRDPVEPVAVDPVEAGATLTLEQEVTLRLNREPGVDGGRLEDLQLPAGATIELRGGDAAVAGPAVETEAAEWKRWGFTNDVSAARVVLGLVAVLALVVLVREWRLVAPGTRVSRLGWFGLAVTATLAIQWLGRRAFTSADDGETATEVKDWIVARGEDLGSFDLVVVLVVLVVLSILIALGSDLVATRAARSLRRRALEVFRTGGHRLDRLVSGVEPTPETES